MKVINVIQTLLLVFKLSAISIAQTKTIDFKTNQIKNIRVKDAYNTKWPQIQNELKTSKINANTYDIYLRVFKHEKTVEVWLKNPEDSKYILFKTYAICSSSGDLGPKRKEGDGQVPEGFYTIDLFNPTSNYYLSMRVNYPNKSDAILKSSKNAGGAIMIHGNCVTIGCIPITDDKIKELYILCLEAKNRNRTIKVDIFPLKMTTVNMKYLETNYSKDKLTFWNSLKPAYDYFEKNLLTRKVLTDAKGQYSFKD